MKPPIQGCPQCGSAVAPADRYCRGCGSLLEADTPGTEYRLVTILCSDLSGYSLLSERLDPEELKALMDWVIDEATQIIVRHGGIVEKYIGDAVVAIFGSLRSREDDPVRAINAAREIHTMVGGLGKRGLSGDKTPLSMHTGINTGEVLFDNGKSFLSSHGVLGKPISIASRLCDMASRGEILIGEALVLTAQRYFHLEWMGRKMLKGFRTPVHVYRVMGERKIPIALHRVGGVTSPMVGRGHELSVLLSKARELRAGRGAFVSIIGDAGLGKSRLIEEFKGCLDEAVAFFSATCIAHAGATPYFPFTALIPQILKISGDDMDTHAISNAAVKIGLPMGHAPHLAFLLGHPYGHECISPDVLKEKAGDALFMLLSTIAGSRPTCVCIEDIHWADQSTRDFLAYLVHAWGDMPPCLLILTHRPEIGHVFGFTHLKLRELKESEVGQMLKGMLDCQAIPGQSVRRLSIATGGNPFFLEEMVNYLLEKGIDPSGPAQGCVLEDVPAGINGLISSRLDCMDAFSKRLLQEASLIGRSFSGDLLACVCSRPSAMGEGLLLLIKHGFINHVGAHEYVFRHDITREVVSRTVLRKDRIMIHKKIAMELESRLATSEMDLSAEIAHHFSHAQEYTKALQYHVDAAGRCQDSGSWVEAASHYMSALKHLKAQPGIPDEKQRFVEIREGIWRCCRIFDPTLAITALEALSSQYRQMGRMKDEAFAFIRLINLYSQKGQFEKALQSYDYASSIIADDPVYLSAAKTAIAYTYTFLGRLYKSLDLLDKSRPILETSQRFLLAVNILTTLAAYVWRGDIESAHLFYARTKELSQGYMDMDLMADMWFAHICCLEGLFDLGRRVFEEVSERERKLGRVAGGLSYLRIQGSIYFRARYFGDIHGARIELDTFDELGSDIKGSKWLMSLYQAWIAFEEGKAHLARELSENALPGLRDGFANRVPYALNILSESYLVLGGLVRAEGLVKECIAWNEANGNRDQLIWAMKIQAEISIAQGDYLKAHQALRDAFRLARTCRMKPHQAWILVSWGDLFTRINKPGKAAICLNSALSLWKEMGNTHQANKAVRLLERLRR